MSVSRVGPAGLVMLLLCANPAVAETTGPFGTREQSANAPGEVLPLAISDRNITPDARSDADRLAAKLNALFGVVNQAPVLRQPKGFSVEPTLYTAVDDNRNTGPLAGGLSLYFRPVYLDWTDTRLDSRTRRYFTPHPTDGISFLVNQPERLLGEVLGRDAEGEFHTAPELVARGNNWYEHRSHKYHLLVHHDNGRMPYRPVTVERYLNHLIAEARQRVEEDASQRAEWNDYAAGNSAGPSQEELLAEIRQTEQDLIAGGMSRAEVEAMLQPLRESLAEYQPVTVDTSEIAGLVAEGESTNREYLRALEAEFAALSPEQRKGPACQYLGEPDKTPMSGLDVHCGDPRGMIVELNPAFFDTKRPRSEVQLLMIHYFPRRGNGGVFSYLDVAQTVMEALRQEDLLAAVR